MCKIDIESIKKLMDMVDHSNPFLFQLETNNFKLHMTKGDTKNAIIKEDDQYSKLKFKSKILKERRNLL